MSADNTASKTPVVLVHLLAAWLNSKPVSILDRVEGLLGELGHLLIFADLQFMAV